MESKLAELYSLLSWPVITVWLASAGLALFWVELVKANAKRQGVPLGPLTLVIADSGLAAGFAFFFGFFLFGWNGKDAITHAVGVAIALPLLCIFLFRKVATMAPDMADDLGWDGVPTQYRVDDDKTDVK